MKQSERSDGDYTVIKIDPDGAVVCRNNDTGEEYSCGETLEEFGIHNLTEVEKRNINLCQTCEAKVGTPRIDKGLPAGTHCDECWDQTSRINHYYALNSNNDGI